MTARTLLALAFLSTALLGSVTPALAQGGAGDRAEAAAEVHLLEIRDGRIWHDGQLLPEAELPGTLADDGLSLTFEYAGPVTPALALNGRLYALEGEELVELDRAELAERPQAYALVPELVVNTVPVSERAAPVSAEEAYLKTLSEHDRALYERLMREREMVSEAHRLAYSYRRAPDDAVRTRLGGQLRAKLEAMFELKQENRREEIRQVEYLLEALRTQLQERQAMKNEIIDRRMRELTGH